MASARRANELAPWLRSGRGANFYRYHYLVPGVSRCWLCPRGKTVAKPVPPRGSCWLVRVSERVLFAGMCSRGGCWQVRVPERGSAGRSTLPGGLQGLVESAQRHFQVAYPSLSSGLCFYMETRGGVVPVQEKPAGLLPAGFWAKRSGLLGATGSESPYRSSICLRACFCRRSERERERERERGWGPDLNLDGRVSADWPRGG